MQKLHQQNRIDLNYGINFQNSTVGAGKNVSFLKASK